MERYPKYVHALGMISIENSSLKSCLGELLGIILGIHPHIGHTLYFTPRAAIARLDLIENVINDLIGDDDALSKRVRAVVRRSKAAMGKRHAIVHSLWVGEEGPVARISFPDWGGDDVSLKSLNALISDYRGLVEEVQALHDDVQNYRGLGYKRPYRPNEKPKIS